MGWDQRISNSLFSVTTDSHGGEREKKGEEMYKEFVKDLRAFLVDMEEKYNVDGIIRFYNWVGKVDEDDD